VLKCLILFPRLEVVKLLQAGALPRSSDSFQLVDSAMACLDSGALASVSCPWVGPARGELHDLLLQVGAAITALVPVAAADYPKDRSTLLRDPFAAPVLVVEATKKRIGQAQPEQPLGRVEAIAGTACLSLYSMHGALLRGESRLLCRRLPRRRESVVEGCCSARLCS